LVNKKLCTTSIIAMVGALALSPAMAFAQATTIDAARTDSTAASADSGTGTEIIVTAQRRQERQVDVPITVTTLGAAQLESANVQDLSDISRVTPSLRFDNAAAFAQPTIRGIGTGVTTSGGGANVGIYIDGFYSPNPLAADSQLMNVQSIQVLKGPQGTLFGRNTTGGAILIQTAEPSEEPAAQFKASYGRYNEFKGQGYVTYGLADGLSFDVEGMYTRGDGWVTNIVDGNDKVGKYKNWSVRTGLKMDFSEDVSLLVRYMHGDVNDGRPMMSNTYVDPVAGPLNPSFVPPSLYTTNPDLVAIDRPTYFHSISNTVQATLKVDLGFADLTSYSQYRGENVDSSQNLDNTGATIFQLGLPVKNETWSQEVLLNSKPGPRLQWTGGLFYFSNRDQYITFADNAGSFRNLFGPTRIGGSSTTTKSYAAFLDATYEITPKFFVTAGARYAHDVVTDAYFNAGPAEFPVPGISGNRVTPRFVLRYKPNEQSSIYASFTQGYKAAILDVGGTCQNLSNIPTPQNPTGAGRTCSNVQPEKINAYEIGYKYSERNLSVELAAFYYDYKNLQVSLFLAGQANILNAANSKIYGVEGSLRYELFDGFEINAGASYTHARYKDFPLAPVYTRNGVGTFDVVLTPLRNSTMPHTPDFTGNLGARYRTTVGGGELQLSGNLYYTSSFFFGPSGNQFPQNSYAVLAARAQWTDRSDKFTLAVYGDNLTNSRYVTAIQYNTIGIGSNWSQPTTYGVEVGVKF
jgi:iron complex outermembrane receptor protein